MARAHSKKADQDMDRFTGVLRDLERRTAELEKMVKLIPLKRQSAMTLAGQR